MWSYVADFANNHQMGRKAVLYLSSFGIHVRNAAISRFLSPLWSTENREPDRRERAPGRDGRGGTGCPTLERRPRTDGKYGYLSSGSLLFPDILQQISGIGTAHLKVNWTDDDPGTRGSGVRGVTPNGKYVYFAGGPAAYGSIDVYKTETAKPALVKAFGFDAGPLLMLAPGGRWAYAGLVFLNGTSTIQVISGAQSAPKLAGKVKLPHGALPEVMQPDGAYGYGASWSDTGLGKPSWVVAFSGASTGHLAGAASWKLPYQVTSIEVSSVKA